MPTPTERRPPTGHDDDWLWDKPESPNEHEQTEMWLLRWLFDTQRQQGKLLVKMLKGQERLMADIAALEASLAEVKSSAETASAAVMAALDATSEQIGDLRTQIDELVAAQVTQEQIDALAQTAADADTIIDSISEAVAKPGEPV